MRIYNEDLVWTIFIGISIENGACGANTKYTTKAKLYNVKQERVKEGEFVLFIHGEIQIQSTKG